METDPGKTQAAVVTVCRSKNRIGRLQGLLSASRNAAHPTCQKQARAKLRETLGKRRTSGTGGTRCSSFIATCQVLKLRSIARRFIGRSVGHQPHNPGPPADWAASLRRDAARFITDPRSLGRSGRAT